MTTIKTSDKIATTKKGKRTTKKESVTIEKPAEVAEQKVEKIELDQITLNPFNPRKHNSDEDLQELAASIKSHGVIQPITVRAMEGSFEIICGERRYHASLIADFKTIPAIIKQLSDEEAMEVTIVENLQRKDISPVEESNAFKLLMDKRSYSIEELSGRFGKSDSYVRGRLQLCNLIEEISLLLSKDEITITASLELSKLCSEIQTEIYNEHLKEDNGYQCWRNLTINDFRSRIEKKYCNDLSKFDFDKKECSGCRYNSALQDLFAMDKCGNCQNIACLQEKQRNYMIDSTIQIVDANNNYAACVRPNHGNSTLIENLKEQGVNVYEMYPSRFPIEPQKPLADNFDSPEEYNEAVQDYEADVIDFKDAVESIEKLESEGKIQRLVDVSNAVPAIGYRVIPEEDLKLQEDPIEKMKAKDIRNKEISIEKTVSDTKQFISNNSFPDTEFTEWEEVLLSIALFNSFRSNELKKIGVKESWNPTIQQKIKMAEKSTEKQRTTIKREYISNFLSGACESGKLAELFLEFSAMHFPDTVEQIKKQHDDVYDKRHESLSERIKAAEKHNNNADKEKIVLSAKARFNLTNTDPNAITNRIKMDEDVEVLGNIEIVDVKEAVEGADLSESEDTSDIIADDVEKLPHIVPKSILIDQSAKEFALDAM